MGPVLPGRQDSAEALKTAVSGCVRISATSAPTTTDTKLSKRQMRGSIYRQCCVLASPYEDQVQSPLCGGPGFGAWPKKPDPALKEMKPKTRENLPPVEEEKEEGRRNGVESSQWSSPVVPAAAKRGTFLSSVLCPMGALLAFLRGDPKLIQFVKCHYAPPTWLPERETRGAAALSARLFLVFSSCFELALRSG